MSNREFLSALNRALPGEASVQRASALRAYAGAIQADFGGAVTAGMATRVAHELGRNTMPTYPELAVVIKRALGGKEGATGQHSRETEAWLRGFANRVSHLDPPKQREAAVAFSGYAPSEVVAAARQRFGGMFPDRESDDVRLDNLWWWARMDALEAVRDRSIRLEQALGMRAVLTRKPGGTSPGDRGAAPRPELLAHLAAVIEDLQEGGAVLRENARIDAPRYGWHPKSPVQVAPPPKGPSKDTDAAVDGPKAIQKLILAPLQHALSLIKAVEDGREPEVTRSAQVRLNAVISNYPGKHAKESLLRAMAAGNFNGEDGLPNQARLNVVERAWADQAEKLKPYWKAGL